MQTGAPRRFFMPIRRRAHTFANTDIAAQYADKICYNRRQLSDAAGRLQKSK